MEFPVAIGTRRAARKAPYGTSTIFWDREQQRMNWNRLSKEQREAILAERSQDISAEDPRHIEY